MKSSVRVLVVAFAAVAAGCVWLEGGTSEQSSLPDQKPRTAPTGDGKAAQGGGPSATNPGIDPRTPSPGELPSIERPRWQPILPELALWPGGLRTATLGWGGSNATLRIAIAHRRIDGPTSVLALLTARLVADAPREGGTLPSLRQRLADFGGELLVDVDPTVTQFSVTVPGWRTGEVLREFVGALRSAPTTAERIEAARAQLARELADRWSDEPLAPAIDRVRAFELRGLGEWLAAIEDATVVDVGKFHRETYEPRRMVIAAAIGMSEVPRFRAEIQSAFEPWLTAAIDATPELVPLAPPASGVFWAEGDGRARVAIVIDLPPHVVPDATTSLVAAEYLGAPGGVIERALREALPGLGMISRKIVSEGARRRLDLWFDLEATQVEVAWNSTRRAFETAARQRANAVDVTAAANRALVALAAEFREPSEVTGALARAMLAGALADVVLGIDGKELAKAPAKTDWTATIRALERPESIELGPVLSELAKRRPLFVVVGGRPGEFATDKAYVAVPGAFVSPTVRDAATAGSEEQETAATELLRRAAAVFAGPLPVLVVDGFRCTSVTRSGRGPEAVDVELFHADGRYRRVRGILATTIETTVTSNGGYEHCGSDERYPEPDEIASILAPLRRHPLLLLAEWSRGKTRYRLATNREIDGRPHAILERLNDGPEPLRIFVDVESAIPRIVTWHEDRPAGRVYVRDEWRNFGEIGGGMRAPLHRTTFFDDGQYGLVTRWTSFLAAPPDQEMLQAGGPLR